MEKEKLTKNEIVIAQLMDGDTVTSQDIADKVSGNGEDAEKLRAPEIGCI